ncbi:chromogranin-A [Gadus macrocephalus]|uniref:chromogranin-A n=1 Tax=Gadus macrocephalus TaxID=80720 RepID=UPI0028CB57A9|nr:chromogranin-A [Gadus macrocephalus]
MIERAVVLLVTFSTCVLSLPVTSGELESGDVKVMKCIVEALADVLSMPHPVPVSQECLDTLRTGKKSTRDLTPPGPHPRP